MAIWLSDKGEIVKETSHELHLKEIQEHVKGNMEEYIHPVEFKGKMYNMILCNEDGNVLGMSPNPAVDGLLVGPVILVNFNAEGDCF